MLALRTKAAWTSAVVTFNDGVGPPQNWTPSAGVDSFYDAVVDLSAWLAGAFGDLASFTWERDPATGGAIATIELSSPFTVTANAVAQTVLGLPAGPTGPGTLHVATSPSGTWAPSSGLDVASYYRALEDRGMASGVGALRSGVPGATARPSQVVGSGPVLDVARIVDELSQATTSREAWVWYALGDYWVLVSLGAGRASPVGRLLHRYTFEAVA